MVKKVAVNKKDIYKFKADNKYVSFPSQFVLENISENCDKNECREVYFKVNAYDFSFDYDVTDKSEILNIHKHSIVEN